MCIHKLTLRSFEYLTVIYTCVKWIRWICREFSIILLHLSRNTIFNMQSAMVGLMCRLKVFQKKSNDFKKGEPAGHSISGIFSTSVMFSTSRVTWGLAWTCVNRNRQWLQGKLQYQACAYQCTVKFLSGQYKVLYDSYADCSTGN